MIKVLIADDQSLIREGLSMMLSLYKDIIVVGEVVNGKEAIEIVDNEEVDLILMDIRMPIMNGVEATEIIKKEYPNVKILILTTFDEDEYIFEGLQSGADGYLLKDISSEELVNAIKTVYEGNVLLQPAVAKKLVGAMRRGESPSNPYEKNFSLSTLTQRELEISRLVAEGKSNKEIGAILFIAEGTVKNHITRILDKLNARDRIQLALFMSRK